MNIIELTALDWHKISTEEALTRLAVSPKTGLDKPQAQRRLQQHGKNVITPPKSNLLRKVLGWVFGGFGTLLLFASIICFIAWYIQSNFSSLFTRLSPSPLTGNLLESLLRQ